MPEQDPYTLFPEAEYDRMVRLSQQDDPRFAPAARDELLHRYKHYESRYDPVPPPTSQLARFATRASFATGSVMLVAGIAEKDFGLMRDSALFLLFGKVCLNFKRSSDAEIQSDYLRLVTIRDLLTNGKETEV